MAKILVIRLSAIGDVAMTVPVIYSAAKANNPKMILIVNHVAFSFSLFIRLFFLKNNSFLIADILIIILLFRCIRRYMPPPVAQRTLNS